MQAQLKDRFAHLGKEDEEFPDVSEEQFEKQAKRKVALGFIFSQLIDQLKITLDQEKVKQRLESMAAMFGQSPEELMSWFAKNQHGMQQIQMSIMEDQVLDKIIEEVAIKDKEISYQDVLDWRPDEEK